MQPRPSAEAIRLAEQKNAAAMKLIAKGKLREALHDLNDAIWIASSYPQSYVNRANVFDRLGMGPQATADRQRARQLAPVAQGVERSEEEAPLAAPPLLGRPGRAGGSGSGRRGLSIPFGGLPRLWVVRSVIAIVVVGAIVVGLVFGLGALDGGDSGVASSSSPSPTPAATPSPTSMVTPVVTPIPTPLPVPLPVGSPFSYVDLQEVWEARDITVTLGGESADFSGFSAAPFEVSLTRGEDSMELVLLVYGGREAARSDWDLVSGRAPEPKVGRTLPDHGPIWWNRNVVVVTLARTGEISSDALAAFFTLNP
ncbi:MAG: hypothetical protein V3S00_03665 [Dehalococcoidia bacterium]